MYIWSHFAKSNCLLKNISLFIGMLNIFVELMSLSDRECAS